MKRFLLLCVSFLAASCSVFGFGGGSRYVDFTSRTPDGKDITLSSFIGEGKWVLIDFWASWCPYCREENPDLVKVYDKYHRKGFEIISVSMDKDRNAWVKAIKDDGMKWINVSDLPSSDIANQYKVRYLPSNFLISPDGEIVKVNIDGEELFEYLSKKIE